VFLEDGRVEMDANPVETTIRPLTPNRKDALFAGHGEGGRSRARIASRVETCKLDGVEPFASLKTALEAIAPGHLAARIDKLLPSSFLPASS
jgi:hypothetical protein